MLILVWLTLTQLFWLPLIAHSGQVAIPWMLTAGKTLYGDVLEQHAPLTTLIAAGAQLILPLSPVEVVRLLHIVLVLALTLGVYALATRLADGAELAGALGAAVFAWWWPVYGNIAFYFNALLGLLVLLGVLLWPREGLPSLRRMFVIGALLGLATLAKQHAWAAVALYGLWLMTRTPDLRLWVAYGLGALLPTLSLVSVIALQGHFDAYLYWNWTFNLSGIMEGVPLSGDLFRKLVLTHLFVPAFVFIVLRDRRRRWLGGLVLLMWTATALLLYPRFGIIQATALLPFVGVMSGVVLEGVWRDRPAGRRAWNWRTAPTMEVVLLGVGLAALAGWLWTGAAMFVPSPLGLGVTLSEVEFREVAAELQERAEPDDSLFILIEADSTPQIHSMTGLLPPGTWIKGWRWYFEAPGVVEGLLNEWASAPPDWVVVFPDLIASGSPGVLPLLDFVEAHYVRVTTVEAVPLHGDALIYAYSDDQASRKSG